MPPTFTTSDRVVFDFGTRIISVPPEISAVNSQWLLDRCRLAEESWIGISRPAIVTGSGKIAIDIDTNGNPVTTGVLAVLNGWKISTQRSSGSFTIKDIYSADNSIPYVEPSPVPIRYQQTVGSTIVQDTGTGGGSATPEQIWNYPDRALTTPPVTLEQLEASPVIASLAQQLTVSELKALVEEIHLLHGLRVGSPLVVSDSSRSAGHVTQTVDSNENQTTVIRNT